MHSGLSLDVLPQLPPAEVALVDGDHNWYTVFNELRLLQRTARLAGRPAPVVLCHDAGWPYARRDQYCDPETIPAEFRQPWARGGIVRGRSELAGDDGLNPAFCNALYEGGPKNGVLTAVEDFAEAAGEPIAVSINGDQYGLAVLVP